MKKIIVLALLLTISVNAQRKNFNFSVSIDPTATIQEESINLVAEIELQERVFYIKATTQVFTALEGGYLDFGGGMGLNTTLGLFEPFRVYGGIRLGIIKRGSQSYPLFGYESGIDYNLSEDYFIGLRATYDNREDFLYSGADPFYRFSGFVRFGYRF